MLHSPGGLGRGLSAAGRRVGATMSRRVVVDLELGRGFGLGLEDLHFAGFALAVTWSEGDGFVHWSGAAGRALLDYLLAHGEIVGYNLLASDTRVLAGYLLPSERALIGELTGRTIDLHSLLFQATGRRHSLDSVALATLGERKLPRPEVDDADLVAEYCERDVELTRDLDDFRRYFGRLYVAGDREAVTLLPGSMGRGAGRGRAVGV